MVITFVPIIFIALLVMFSIIASIRGYGKPNLSEPYCAKCNYDLRVNWDSSMACPECGADLKAKNAVNFGKIKKRPTWVIVLIIAVVIIINLLLLGGVLLPTRRAITVTPTPVTPQTTQTIPQSNP